MSIAEAGPLPWSESWSAFTYKGKGSRKAKAAQRALGYKWSPKRKQWLRNVNAGRENATAKWEPYVFANRKVLGELTEDYKNKHVLSSTSGAADYIDYSFNNDKNNVSAIEGCGHIKYMEYNIETQVLRVTFTNNGNVVCYFAVPSTVVGELYNYAETKAMMDSTHHILGSRFWDLIRVRHTIHGTRYSFVYTTDNGYRDADGNGAGEGHKYGARWTGKRAEDIAEYNDWTNLDVDTMGGLVDRLIDTETLRYYNERGEKVRAPMTVQQKIRLKSLWDNAVDDESMKALYEYIKSIDGADPLIDFDYGKSK